jgi:hypothetical protein
VLIGAFIGRADGAKLEDELLNGLDGGDTKSFPEGQLKRKFDKGVGVEAVLDELPDDMLDELPDDMLDELPDDMLDERLNGGLDRKLDERLNGGLDTKLDDELTGCCDGWMFSFQQSSSILCPLGSIPRAFAMACTSSFV